MSYYQLGYMAYVAGFSAAPDHEPPNCHCGNEWMEGWCAAWDQAHND